MTSSLRAAATGLAACLLAALPSASAAASTSPDLTSPTASRATLTSAQQVTVGDAIVIETDLADDTALSYGYLYLNGPSGRGMSLSYSDGAFRGTVTANDPSGTYKLSNLYAYDTNNNSVSCSSYEYTYDGATTTNNSCYRSSDGYSSTTLPFEPNATFRVTRDATAPVVAGAPASPANAAGWHRAPVDIVWTATDPAPSEGAASTPAVTRATTEAKDVVYTSDRSCDGVGNCASGSATISLDATAPEINLGQVPAPSATGWHTSAVTLTAQCTDALSGVATCPEPVTVSDGADQSPLLEATDVAGNTAFHRAGPLSVDTAGPALALSYSAKRSADGWFSGPVTISASCTDVTSGVASCPAPVTVSGDGADQSVKFTATDVAGNTTTVTADDLDLDNAAPTAAAQVSGTRNAAGWYREPVTVRFACTDDLSGIASCTAATVLQTGLNQSVSGQALDRAGHVAAASATGINVDMVLPTVALSTGKATYTADEKIAVACSGDDDLSGVVRLECPAAAIDAWSLQAGANTLTGSATDKAGNIGTSTADVTVTNSFASQKALTSRMITNTKVVTTLNKYLSDAESAKDATARGKAIEKYKIDVNSQVGKSTTRANADVLIRWVAVVA